MTASVRKFAQVKIETPEQLEELLTAAVSNDFRKHVEPLLKTCIHVFARDHAHELQRGLDSLDGLQECLNAYLHGREAPAYAGTLAMWLLICSIGEKTQIGDAVAEAEHQQAQEEALAEQKWKM